jgi:predicted nucleic acid-binding protein
MKILVDSDFLVALYKPDDSNHIRAKKIFKSIEGNTTLFSLNLVFQESTTVISKRMGMVHARKFFELINHLVKSRIDLDEKLEKKAWQIFLKQTKKGTSFVDCANWAALREFKLDKIASFDKAYAQNTLISMV